MKNYFKKWDKICDLSHKYLKKGKYLKYLKLQMYLCFLPLKNRYIWLFVFLSSALCVYLEYLGVIK